MLLPANIRQPSIDYATGYVGALKSLELVLAQEIMVANSRGAGKGRRESTFRRVHEGITKCPASGEIDRKVADATATLQRLHDTYAADALEVDDTDGYSFEFAGWRFNVRMSNTKRVVRLNVETREDPTLLDTKTKEVLAILES